MDKTSERVNRLTLDFSNKVYEELSTIVSHREDLRYFNYDSNDKNIDNKINKMFDLIDDIYNSCIEKKTGWITKNFTLVPKKNVEEEQPNIDIFTPSPRTPKKNKKKDKKIKVEEKKVKKRVIKEEIKEIDKKTLKDDLDNKIIKDDIFEIIMYSSDEEKSDKEEEKRKEWIKNNPFEYSIILQSCKGVSLKVNEEIDKRIYTTPS